MKLFTLILVLILFTRCSIDYRANKFMNYCNRKKVRSEVIYKVNDSIIVVKKNYN